jgi:hypothetical protein
MRKLLILTWLQIEMTVVVLIACDGVEHTVVNDQVAALKNTACHRDGGQR